MNRHRESAPHVCATPTTLWLILRLGQSNWLFDFAPGHERAVVVGRNARANVRIERRGVAPIHFHFEREGEAIRLIPGYADELWVNGSRVRGAQILESASRIEFSGLRLEAHFFAIDSDLLLPVSARVDIERARRGSRTALDIPDPMSATRVAFRTNSPPPLSVEPLPNPAAPPLQGSAEVTPAPRALRTEQLKGEFQALSRRSEALSIESNPVAPSEPVSLVSSNVIYITGAARRRQRRSLRVRVGQFLSRTLGGASRFGVVVLARLFFKNRETKALSTTH